MICKLFGKKVDFILYYEHAQRELYGIQLLAFELRRRGYSVMLCGNPIGREADFNTYFTSPEVVVYPWVYRDKDLARARLFPNKPYKIVNLQSEQVLSEYSASTGWNIIKDEAKKAWHVAWGARSAERFVSWGIEPSHIWECGSIHLDFADEKWDELFLTKDKLAEQFGLKSDRKWAIFFSSFSHTNLPEDRIRWFSSILSGYDEFRKVCAESKDALIEWFERFVRDNAEVEFIYRPHPGEMNDNKLTELAELYQNFHYISEYPATQWIRVCEKILSWVSSSMVDAFYRNKPFALLRPARIDEKYESELFYGGQLTESFGDFEAFIADDCSLSAVSQENFTRYYMNTPDSPAYKRLADKLEWLYKSNAEEPFDKPEAPQAFFEITRRTKLRALFGRRREAVLRERRVFEEIKKCFGARDGRA